MPKKLKGEKTLRERAQEAWPDGARYVGTGHGPGACPNNVDKDEYCARCKCKGHRAPNCRTPESSLARCVKAGEKRREHEKNKAGNAWSNYPQKGGRPSGGSQGKVSSGQFGTLPPQALADVPSGVNPYANFANAPGTSSSAAARAMLCYGVARGRTAVPGSRRHTRTVCVRACVRVCACGATNSPAD